MANPSLFFSRFLSRRLRSISSLSTLSLPSASDLFSNPNPLPSHPPVPFHNSHNFHSAKSFSFFHFSLSRSFSTRSNDEWEIFSDLATESPNESQIGNDSGLDKVTEGIVDGLSSGEDSILPVRALISLLDGYHDLTGFPWWIVIVSSTVAMRMTLFPLLILQLKKLKRISELFPKLPPPFPPPLSGRSFIDQISLFQKERLAIGCPSYLWFLAYFSVQVPCFFLWVTSIRRMSLDRHPGFDSGGTLWFQNLTELPHGVLGPIFPLLIAGLHYVNVQLSFEKSSLKKAPGLLGLLLKFYKTYLDLLTLPLLFIGFYLPQGSMVYWVTNSSISAIQQLSLKHPAVRAKLGLPDKDSPTVAANSEAMGTPKMSSLDSPKKWRKVSAENLSPKQLLALSVQLLSNGHNDSAIPLLRQALEKDPDYVRALTVLGQTLLQKGQHAEATEHLEHAVCKLLLVGHLTEAEDVDLLILASQWAGVACIRQGKNAEGLVHLQRVGSLEEPEDPKSKAHYFDGLLFLASALYNEGRKAEAAKYLRLVVAYNPARKELLEHCENDEDNFVSDLVTSRRGDY